MRRGRLTALYVLIGQTKSARFGLAAVRLAPANTAAHKRFAVSFMPTVLARQRLWDKERVVVDGAALKGLNPWRQLLGL